MTEEQARLLLDTAFDVAKTFLDGHPLAVAAVGYVKQFTDDNFDAIWKAFQGKIAGR